MLECGAFKLLLGQKCDGGIYRDLNEGGLLSIAPEVSRQRFQAFSGLEVQIMPPVMRGGGFATSFSGGISCV